MKTLIKSALIGLAIVGVAQAATSTQNSTQTVTTSTANFTFTKFDPALGTLNAIDLIIQSSTLSGNITYVRSTGSYSFTGLQAQLSINATALGLGEDDYTTDAYTYLRSPSGNFTLNSGTTSKLLTVNGTTQSLISNTPVTISLGSSVFSDYTGAIGTKTIIVDLLPIASGSGTGTYNITSTNFLSPTSLSLVYTYTTPPPPSPVPEPSQVAASFLVAGGIGFYIFMKRRRQTASVL